MFLSLSLPHQISSMIRVLAIFMMLAATVTHCSTLTQGDTPALMFSRLQAVDGSLTAAATMTLTKTGSVMWPLSQVYGQAGPSRNKKMSFDSCFAMHSMSEILVSYAAVKLLQDTNFATSLDDAIATAFSPSGLTMQNPNNQKAISYKMLMTHTSTIRDVNFGAATLATPNTVGTLAAFIDNYFVTTGGQLVSSVFVANKEPGTASAYNFAKVNIALLAYILERIIANNNLGYASLKHYIAQEVLTPFGMSSTFFLQPDGSAPGIVAAPDFSGSFTAAATGSSSAYASYFQGCIVDQTTVSTVLIHPAYPADFMAYTTVSDLMALMNALFMDTRFQSISLLMKERLTVDASVAQQAQSGQGLSLVYYNGATVCDSGLNTLTIRSCSLSNVSTVVGYAVSRGTTTLGFFCSETSAFGQFCTASVFIYSSSATRSYDAPMAMAAAAFQEMTGTVTLTTPAPLPALRTEGEERWFGVYVFIAVYLSIMIVIFGTSLLQYFFQPAALATNANTASATYAMGDIPGPSPRRGPTILNDN